MRADIRRNHRSKPVERLRKIQLPLRVLRRAHISRIWIGTRLQESGPACRYEQRYQEHRIISRIRRRQEQQRPRRKKKKSAQYPFLISKPMKEETRRQGKNEIAQIYRKVNEGGLRITQLTDLLQMRDQYPIDIMQKGPQKKQRADQDERET